MTDRRHIEIAPADKRWAADRLAELLRLRTQAGHDPDLVASYWMASLDEALSGPAGSPRPPALAAAAIELAYMLTIVMRTDININEDFAGFRSDDEALEAVRVLLDLWAASSEDNKGAT